MIKFVVLSTVVFCVFSTLTIQAEPWISQRYAQNCAGCHAPGRLNLPPKGRRCTLSCQGCHVSPQGGGIRNQYGMWNQQRWLASMKNTKLFGHKDLPAIHTKQPYMKTKPKKGKYPVKKFATTKKVTVKEYRYGNKYYKDWHKDADSKRHFLSRVPRGDPYRLERDFSTTVNGDLRLMYLSGDIGGVTPDSVFFPMSFDFGVRIRPTREKYSFVVESRFANGPDKTEWDHLFENQSYVRSAYFLADDLIYNSFVMFGLFRPMFGNYNPDHHSLSNQITGLGQAAVYKGLSLGTAPNVPFGNLSIIQPMSESSMSQDEGVVVNLGGRFVTLSGSLLFSYWSTEKPAVVSPHKEKTDLMAFVIGGKWKELIGTLEYVMFEFQEIQGASLVKNAGNVMTFEGKYRFYKENYAVFNYAMASTAVAHTEGKSNQMQLGVKSFLYPGMEVEMLYISDSNTEASVTTDTSRMQAQLHLSF